MLDRAEFLAYAYQVFIERSIEVNIFIMAEERVYVVGMCEGISAPAIQYCNVQKGGQVLRFVTQKQMAGQVGLCLASGDRRSLSFPEARLSVLIQRTTDNFRVARNPRASVLRFGLLQEHNIGIGMAPDQPQLAAVERPVKVGDLFRFKVRDLPSRRTVERLQPEIIYSLVSDRINNSLAIRSEAHCTLSQTRALQIDKFGVPGRIDWD